MVRRSQECVVDADLFSDCLLLADDFFQYYLGAYRARVGTEPDRLHRRR